MTIKSFAKINLGLNILNKRNDGYHELQTIFYPINLFDILTFTAATNISISCNPDLGIQEDRNIAFKTAKLLQKYFDCKLKGINIKIQKNIPDGAGLGGGSSNAATTLLALNKLWHLNLKKEDMMKLASELGADVPFFLLGKPAIGSGIGEILEPIDLNIPFKIIVVTSKFKISTAFAYKTLNRDNEKVPKKDLHKIVKQINENPYKMKELLNNDFEDIAFKLYPQLKKVKNLLYQHGAVYAQMTGSGSAIFAMFENLDSIQTIRDKISPSGFKIHIVQS